MTPLYQRIVRELTLPVKRRTFADYAGVVPRLSGAKCFEVSAVWAASAELAIELVKRPTAADDLTFLPAPKTWIEFEDCERRIAWFLEEASADVASLTIFNGASYASLPAISFFTKSSLTAAGLNGGLFIPSKGSACELAADTQLSPQQHAAALFYRVQSVLAMINTPRVIGRTTHQPHQGLQRALLARQDLVGHWPLQAWHEIKLEVRPPEEHDGPPVEGVLTGTRALHFVRAHLRIARGVLVLVKAHWRGDGSKGIKQGRYRVALPQSGQPFVHGITPYVKARRES